MLQRRSTCSCWIPQQLKEVRCQLLRLLTLFMASHIITTWWIQASSTLSFRLLRRALELHNISNAKMSQINAVAMHDEDRQDMWIREQVWYLPFIGFPPFEISELLRRFNEANSTSCAPQNASSVNDQLRHLRTWPEAAQVRQGVNAQLPIAGHVIGSSINKDIDRIQVHLYATAQNL